MNEETFRKRLEEVRIPAPDSAARDRTLHRSLIALAHAPKDGAGEEPALRRVGFGRWLLAGGVVAVAALLALWQVGPAARDDQSAAWRRTLAEMEALFPGQVRAVIERDGNFEVELFDQPVGGATQPVVVEFRQDSHALRVLSYSGRRVCVDLGEAKACFEPLVTADGGVILDGENFLWTAEHPASPGGYRVQARFLLPAS